MRGTIAKIKRNKKAAIIATGLIVFILVLTAMAMNYLRPYPAEEKYIETARSDDSVVITEKENLIEISLSEAKSERAIIFYPGGLVEPQAYIYKLSQLSQETNSAVFVVNFPLNLAVMNIDAADEIISANPEVEEWIIMGHSLGGAMACRYAGDSGDRVSTLVLLASYCDQDISQSDLIVLSLYGSCDGVLNVDALAENDSNLPPSSDTIVIEGMNHAQFGNYGEQDGDKTAEIRDEEALSVFIDEIVSFLAE
jgi:dienelactone hydrolase